jgi:ferredoxin
VGDAPDGPDAADVVEAGVDVAPDVAPDGPRPDGGRTCVTNADCDDGVGCTLDACRGGVCSRVPDYTLCGDTENCDPRAGCVPGRACSRDSDCAEPDPCRYDPFCDTTGVCLYDYLDDDFDGEPPVACGGGDCDDSRPSVGPGEAERCDGVDNNCDGRVDEEGATPLCPGGACAGGRCACMASGLLLCAGRCVDVMSDAANCGRCGNACPAGRSCVGGACDCAAGRTSCAGRCVDTQADNANCGRCGAICPAGQTCTDGACASICGPGVTFCSGSCVDTQTDRANCGGCAVACPAEAITMVAAERKKGEEKLYREEKYASVYEINMLRCIFCGDCEEACPKEAIFLTDRLVPTDYERMPFVYGKQWLVEPLDPSLRVDVSKRQTPEVIKFKEQKQLAHNR